MVSINISVVNNALFLYSGFPYNPTNKSLNNALLFLDFMINDSSSLDQTNFAPINITILYNADAYENIKIYWYNTSQGENGVWELIPFVDLGKGKILITINHTSILGFTGTLKQVPPTPGDDDDDDEEGDGKKEEEAPGIPFGNFYLLFIAIGIISILVYKKRKM